MGDLFEEPEGATPITAEEQECLKPTWVISRDDLNKAETDNVLAGRTWAYGRRNPNLFTEKFLLELHKRMFGDVWTWAGTIRTTPRNIGVEPYRISTELRTALDDTRYWIENDIYDPDEIAVRLHHRLVLIHPFPNGNGRSTRLHSDLVVSQLGQQPFTWGRENLVEAGATRNQYITALQTADNYDLTPLLEFARS